MPFDVHSLMQDPNHIDRVIRFTVKHNVRASGVAKDVANIYQCLVHLAFGPYEVEPMVGRCRMSRLVRHTSHTRNASANFTQYDAPVGNAASLKS